MEERIDDDKLKLELRKTQNQLVESRSEIERLRSEVEEVRHEKERIAATSKTSILEWKRERAELVAGVKELQVQLDVANQREKDFVRVCSLSNRNTQL